MSENLAKHMQQKKQQQQGKPDHDSPEARAALQAMRREAKAAGSELQPGSAKGGLDSRLALGCYRKGKYLCKRCGEPGNVKKNGGLSIHEIGGVVSSRRLSKKGHTKEQSNLVCMCKKCHDAVHNEARAKGEDSSQVLPEADKGTKKDHGQPLAKPKK